jgi:hypothetical protein
LNSTAGVVRQNHTPQLVLAGLVGVAAGAGSLAGGGYAVSVWANAALVFGALLLAFVVSRSPAPPRAIIVAATALSGLGVVTLISSQWADDRSGPLVDGARWLGYAVAVCAIAAAASDRRGRRVLHLALAITLAAAAVYIELRLLAGSAESLFRTGRLTNPVGYANGQAAVLLMGFWLAFGIAERAMRPAIGAVAGAAATMQLGLVILTATRSAIPAAIAATLCVLAIPRGRLRRGWLLVICVAGAAVAAPAGLAVYDSPHAVAPPDDVARSAAVWLLVGAATTGLIWLFVLGGLSRITGEARRNMARVAAVALVLFVAGGAVATIAVVGNPVTRIDRTWNSFTALRDPPAEQSRFASVGGNRYDYWRVAIDEFRQHPLVGVGGGNYVQDYYALRHTAEYVKQPHSIELQVLSELGIVGALFLLVFLGTVAHAIWRGLRPAAGKASAVSIGAAGVLVTWAVQTSVDWLHLLPAVTLAALAALVLVRPLPELMPVAIPDRPPLDTRWSRLSRQLDSRAVPVGLAVLVACTSIACVRVLLADRYRDRAKNAISQPAQALRQTADSLKYDGSSADTYYLRSAAFARLGDYRSARDELLVVTRRQPKNFLPWVLLGDLATRRGLSREALRSYRRAAMLNPQDPYMKDLVRGAQARPGK